MTADEAWLAKWLDSVADGSATMSQRRISTVAAHGGLAVAVAAAKARGVHLAKLTDDTGIELVAASLHPIVTLC